tara:strand:+ start:2386 stop:3213 length:828 start_codon:yes stop_codon:yes gene_type:complete
MKLKIFTIFLVMIFLSCSSVSEKINNDLSIIVISSDHSVGENILNFAILDQDGNQITNELKKIVIKNIDSNKEKSINSTYQIWFEGKGAYKSNLYFEESGFHELIIYFDNYESKAIFNVNKKSTTPEIGQRPPDIKTLFTNTKSELYKITSDPNPEPDFYNLSYEDSIKNLKPTVILFSTPALCVSGTCGPILNNLKKVKINYDKYNFIHIEVYKNFIGKTLRDLDSLEVTEPVMTWGLPTEPWIFFLDGNGILRSKFEGYMTENEMILELNILE